MKYLWIILSVLFLCPAIYAESLWQPEQGSMFVDKKAHQVGDTITILITENTSSSQKANTSVTKKAKIDAGPGIGPILKMIPELGLEGSTTSSADGSTSRSSNLDAQITVTVTEVKSNGNLVVSGTRNVTTNNETQVIKITGTIRPDDISTDNTVQSTYVADAKIEYSGKGVIAERQKPGIITRIFKYLF